MCDAAISGEGGLELLHLLSQDIPAASSHCGQIRDQLLQERRVVPLEIIQGKPLRDRHSSGL